MDPALAAVGAPVMEAAEQADEGFSLGRFAWGLVKGAAIGLVVGTAAAVVVATAPAWVTVTLGVAAVGAAGYGIYATVRDWDEMSGGDKSQLAGEVIGGVLTGGLSAKAGGAIVGAVRGSGTAGATAGVADDAIRTVADDVLSVTDDVVDDALGAADDALNAADDGLGAGTGGGSTTATRGTASVDDLIGRSKPFANPEEIPGGSGGAMTYGKPGRFLRTMDIEPSDLPYESAVRPRQPVSLPSTLDDAAKVTDIKVTDVVFASDEHSGSAGLVRLADMEGRPVAVKTYYPVQEVANQVDEFVLQEARSAKLYSDLGIGPKYHGIFQDADGKWNVVTDIVPGDFSGTKVTLQTFQDLETMLTRMGDEGIESLGDFQPYRTQDGRMLVIDPGGAAESIGRPGFSPPNSAAGDFTRQRLSVLREASDEVKQAYYHWLRDNDPQAYQGLYEALQGRR